MQKLIADYAFSSQANCRKGGLLCLAAAAVALAEQNKASLLHCRESVHACMQP